jgi:hypothetical protein
MSPCDEVKYPQKPEEWQIWLKSNLGIDRVQGKSLIQDDKFPFDQLVALWGKKFSSDNGYSPSFIPALVRNKVGFVRWVYLNGHEPNWSKSDQ